MNGLKSILITAIAFSLSTNVLCSNPVVINNNNNNNNGNNNPCQNSGSSTSSGTPAGVFNVPTAQGSNTIYSTGEAQPYNADMNNNNCSGQAPIYPQIYLKHHKGSGK